MRVLPQVVKLLIYLKSLNQLSSLRLIRTRRLVRVTENLNRLALDQSHTEILAADATQWTPAQPVDCIVLDAPALLQELFVVILTYAYCANLPI